MRFLAVVGPSGSGKSSVVMAGLIPALRQGFLAGSSNWFIVKMVPGADPFAELEAGLLSVALQPPVNLSTRLRQDVRGLKNLVDEILLDQSDELLLVIDQFEEAFTLVDDQAERARFLNSLASAVNDPDGRLRVVITLRADFYDRPLLYAEFGDLVRANTEVVLPLNTDELRRTVIGPAKRAGLTIDPVLADTIVKDVSEQPGALPLLQYTLTELFERREGNNIPAEAYEAGGGISGALARRADEIYDNLGEDARQIARQVLLRLVALGESTGATRQRVRWSTLLTLAPQGSSVVKDVLDTFGRYRLFTFDYDPQTREPTVEVAHEALIQSWGRLQKWLDDSRADLLTHRRLQTAIQEWINAGHDTSYLATGSRLTQFEAWQESTGLVLNEQERNYLKASIALRQRMALRRRMMIAALVVITIVSFAMAILAFEQKAQTQREARIGRSRELAVTSLINVELEPDLAMLLSLEALNSADTFEAENSLLTALQNNPRLLTILHDHTDWVRSVAFSPDGTLAASGGSDSSVILWDVAEERRRGEPLLGHMGPVNSVAFSPDGTLLASASSDGSIRLWSVATGEPVGTPLTGHTADVWGVAFSPDGQKLASSGADGSIILWDVASGQMIGQPLTGHTGIVYSVAFHPNGRLLASGGEDDTVRLWDATSGAPVGDPLTGHTNWVLDVTFSPDGGVLATTGADATVRLWDLVSGMVRTLRTGHSNWVRSVAFSPDGKTLVTASVDNSMRLWDTESGLLAEQQPLTGHSDAVWSAAFSPDGKLLISGGADHRVILWSMTTPNQLIRQTLTGHVNTIVGLAFSEDGSTLTSVGGSLRGTETNTVYQWDVVAGQPQPAGPVVLSGQGGSITVTALSADGDLAATASADQSIWLWRLDEEPSSSQPMEGPTGRVLSMAFSPYKRWMASASEDGQIVLWNVATRQTDGVPLPAGNATVSTLAFSPDGAVLAVGDRSGCITLWHVQARGQFGSTLCGHQTVVESLAFSPDSQVLASGARDGLVVLWDVKTQEMIGLPLVGHLDWVVTLAFSPDGQRLASGDQGGRIILWDVAARRAVGLPLSGHTERVNKVLFSPDGQLLVSGDLNGMLYIWDVGLLEWREHACHSANRNLTQSEWERYFPDTAYRTTCSFAAG